MTLALRSHVRKFATLLKGRNVVYADDTLVRSAVAAIEGTGELVNDADPQMPVPLHLKVEELRHFIAYVRALDAVARETKKMEERCFLAETAQRAADTELKAAKQRIEALEKALAAAIATSSPGSKQWRKKISSRLRRSR